MLSDQPRTEPSRSRARLVRAACGAAVLYEAHYGLSCRPFQETVNPSAYVPVPTRESALHRLRYALEQGPGPALMFGPPGTGKTLLARRLARDLGGRSAHLTFPAMPAAELLALAAEELGLAPPDGDVSLKVCLRTFRDGLAAASARGERPLLIVDEAHLIDDASTFEALRLLLNFATEGPPDLALLIVGGPEVLLRLPAGLADRLTARCLLGPLGESESAAYVLGRLAAAGKTEPLFSDESLRVLHREADGRPRRLNRLADLALLIAYAEGAAAPDERTVAIAAREAGFEAFAA